MIPKAVIIKLKFLKETHTVTKISEDSETVFYIYFLICNKTKKKQLPISKLLALNFSFCPFTPTIDKEPTILARNNPYVSHTAATISATAKRVMDYCRYG